MIRTRIDLLGSVKTWLDAESNVQSAVLFGSFARELKDPSSADRWSDLDLHIVAKSAEKLEHVDWKLSMPEQQLALQVVRPATGGVKKVTILFETGQIDLVLVPAKTIKLARLATRFGLHRRPGSLRDALNEMATCLWSGYRFLKGENVWGKFYAQIAAEMPGVRLEDAAAQNLADFFLTDLLWVFQKLERGELVAAQHFLHRSLAEINLKLIRELQLRRGRSLPSFGLGRHVEVLLEPAELLDLQISTDLNGNHLRAATFRSFDGLIRLMNQLVPTWQVPDAMYRLLIPYRETKSM